MRLSVSVLLVTLALPAGAQTPERFQNLQVLPPDISRDSLTEIMRGFAFALGVRCEFCHVPESAGSNRLAFHLDDDPDKNTARQMLQMVDRINRDVRTVLAARADPPTPIECKTCHRGLSRPTLLRHELRAALDGGGADSAEALYRSLRENAMPFGVFDFGEWETNTLAEALAREGRARDAIAIYRLNEEFYPESASIALALARLFDQQGEVASAIAYYERVLVLAPNFERARERLAALRGR